MKNIIAISACLKRCSVAILYEGMVHEANENLDAPSNLVWLANGLIKSNNMDIRQINGIIVSSHPGSFTGIRTAQSMANGLALSLKIPLKSVSYFDVIKSIAATDDNHPVLIAIKGRPGEIYYEIDHQKSQRSGVSSYETVKNIISGKCILLGDAGEELIPYCGDKIIKSVHVADFRKAKHFLSLVETCS
jgi:tRNA threonylcarbamoyladenosine biosynthesis protein TsaB